MVTFESGITNCGYDALANYECCYEHKLNTFSFYKNEVLTNIEAQNHRNLGII